MTEILHWLSLLASFVIGAFVIVSSAKLDARCETRGWWKPKNKDNP